MSLTSKGITAVVVAAACATACSYDMTGDRPCGTACEGGVQVDLDHGPLDSAAPDQAPPDLAEPDMALPDLAVPDMVAPDQTTPDEAAPDQAAPDQAVPDSSMADLPKPKAWPFGTAGVLNVTLGTVKLKPGVIHDYAEINVGKYGTLEIEAGSGWAIIGVNGKVKIDGKLVASKGTHTGGTLMLIMPDKQGKPGATKVPHTWVQHKGGIGGISQYSGNYGKPASGNGGGGTAYQASGGQATATHGGNGGSSSGKPGDPGAGATKYGEAGQAGCKCGSGGTGTGGGGGFRGYHGQGLLLQVRGDVSGTGTIDVSGGAGGAGGAGGPGSWGGGGGGGGAGGSAGLAIIMHTGKMLLPTKNIKALGGAGGAAGVGGKSSTHPGWGSKPGEAGSNGASQVLKWVE